METAESEQSIKKILVVTLSNLGDVVLTLPVIQSLRESFPGAALHLVAGLSGADVFQGDPRIQKVIAYNKKMPWREKWEFLKKLRHERYDIIADLRYSLVGFLGGARIRNSYFDLSRKPLRRRDYHLRALKRFGIVPSEGASFLRSDPFAATRMDKILGRPLDERKIIAAAVGSKSDIKKWPPEYYAKLLDRLAEDPACRIVLVGDKSDNLESRKVKDLMSSDALDLCGMTDLKELFYVLKIAALLVTNDSAPLHIADSFKTPVLAIFGPTDPRKYGPLSPGSRVARRELFCSPCEKAQCRFNHECMKELGVDEVHQKALQILRDDFSNKSPRILVARLDRIGDLVLSLPAIEAIRDRFPNARISVMTRSYTQGVVEGHPLVDEVIPYFYEKKGRHSGILGNIRFIREIRKRRFDIAFILHPSHRSYLVPFFAGIPYRIGFRSHAWFTLTKAVPDRRYEGARHEADYTLDVVRAFNIEPKSEKKTAVSFFKEHEEKVSAVLRAASWSGTDEMIAIHPGASCPSKRWPLESFGSLARRVAEDLPYKVAIVGGAEDRKRGEDLRRIAGDSVADFTGRFDLKELAAFLSRCRALVSNDSGPVHIASSVGTPTIALFGRNKAGLSMARWRALGKNHRQIQKDVGCAVCLAHRCTIDFECLRAIGVEEVLGRLKETLEASVFSKSS